MKSARGLEQPWKPNAEALCTLESPPAPPCWQEGSADLFMACDEEQLPAPLAIERGCVVWMRNRSLGKRFSRIKSLSRWPGNRVVRKVVGAVVNKLRKFRPRGLVPCQCWWTQSNCNIGLDAGLGSWVLLANNLQTALLKGLTCETSWIRLVIYAAMLRDSGKSDQWRCRAGF